MATVNELDTVVIGAGVIGLAIARSLAIAGHEVVLLEAEPRFGMHTSSRNSEVIHAGIYYVAQSLKATMCVRGRDLLYAYCRDRAIPHRRIGKFIVATEPSDLSTLDEIAQRAQDNDVRDLVRYDAAEVHAIEPQLSVLGALFSPSTGIIDSHALMRALLADAERNGATAVWSTRFDRAVANERGFVIEASGTRVTARHLVNAAGLHAPDVALRIDGMPPDLIPASYRVKGNYFALRGACPFRHLVYPTPVAGGLGIHLTLDLQGVGRFGPDQEPVDELDYRVDPKRAASFCAAIARYWPAVTVDRLEPSYAGVRPKIRAPGEPASDFVVSGPTTHGIPNLVHLFGIESPGLTAALALAECVRGELVADTDVPKEYRPPLHGER